MKTRASCRWPAAASIKATTRRRRSPSAACWWWRPTWSRRPTTRTRLSRCWARSGLCPRPWARPKLCLRDTGYFSAGYVEACEKAGIEPAIAMGRQPHHPPLAERFEPAPAAPDNPTPVEAMAHRLKTPRGRALYALRKQTPEPVFGIIKSVLGFRQFSLRGLEKVRGEWSLVTMAWNMKRMFALAPAY